MAKKAARQKPIEIKTWRNKKLLVDSVLSTRRVIYMQMGDEMLVSIEQRQSGFMATVVYVLNKHTGIYCYQTAYSTRYDGRSVKMGIGENICQVELTLPVYIM
ncbi:MAG: hypothetical protein HY006_03595 [Candidatus Sungbacteria bacterium]|nr:hypothetical protein [Candidatus Sungbacteria bacterium]